MGPAALATGPIQYRLSDPRAFSSVPTTPPSQQGANQQVLRFVRFCFRSTSCPRSTPNPNREQSMRRTKYLSRIEYDKQLDVMCLWYRVDDDDAFQAVSVT